MLSRPRRATGHKGGNRTRASDPVTHGCLKRGSKELKKCLQEPVQHNAVSPCKLNRDALKPMTEIPSDQTPGTEGLPTPPATQRVPETRGPPSRVSLSRLCASGSGSWDDAPRPSTLPCFHLKRGHKQDLLIVPDTTNRFLTWPMGLSLSPWGTCSPVRSQGTKSSQQYPRRPVLSL